MARRWIKLWVSESLRGTIRFDFTPAERGVWYDLLALAGDCRQDGLISPGDGANYPMKWIAGTLNITSVLLKKTLEICKSSNRLEINQDGIRILNWQKYQSEYERQKPFRYKKVTNKVTKQGTTKLPVEGDIEGDIEGEREKKYIKKRSIFIIPLPEFSNVNKMTSKEYQDLIKEFGEVGTRERIKSLSLYIASQGDKYKNHYATILSWERREKKEQQESGKTIRKGLPGNEPAGAFSSFERNGNS